MNGKSIRLTLALWALSFERHMESTLDGRPKYYWVIPSLTPSSESSSVIERTSEKQNRRPHKAIEKRFVVLDVIDFCC